MHRPRISGRLGFTMVEVLLAMGIFSMVLVSIYTTWSAIMRGTKIAQDAAVAVQRSRVAVRAIEDALNTAQIYVGNPNRERQLYYFEAAKQGEFTTLRLTARLPETFPGSGLFGDQRLRRVEFVVENGTFSQQELHLYQKGVLAPDSEPPFKMTLGRNVDLFKLEFWDSNKKDWVDEWIERQTNSIPSLVRVTIGMGNKENTPMDKREIITRVIAPSAIVVPREYQQPGVGVPPGMMPQPGVMPPVNRANPSVIPGPSGAVPVPF